MAQIVDREYLISLVNQCYSEKESNYYFCMEESYHFCKKSLTVEKELKGNNLVLQTKKFCCGQFLTVEKIQAF